ncbi:hypothetical protein QN277_009012 [Acacia crassicarpa]|uniref:PGG domain-containing protein n=1 Tax=Acacia crassicarpa TaxID=499986 RepID=A0AAE1JN00_9FABA|nr:hypothetical protein QN277_009012 [Acacia crassicarpa]
MSSSVDTQEEKDKKVEELRRDAEKGEWSKVIQAYEQERALRMAKITPTGDTVLHVAVSYGEEKVVEGIVNILDQEEKSHTQDNVVVIVDGDGGGDSSWNKNIFLGVENDRKDTPLHLAGAMGIVRICKKIGGTDPSLIARRNIDGETPLFLAALYGQRDTFLWLHYLYVRSHEVSSTDFAHCIRDNHDSILHCAITGGHLDVAIEIVHLYKDHLKEMMRRNKEGLTPLHLLAGQRSAFETSALLDMPNLFLPVYRCWKVKEKKQATTFEELQKSEHDTPREAPFFRKFTMWVCFLSLVGGCSSLLALVCVLPLVLLLIIVSILIGSLLDIFSVAEAELRNVNIPIMKVKLTRWYQIMTKLVQHASDEDMHASDEDMSQLRPRSASKQFSDSLQSDELNEPEAMAKRPSGTGTKETPLMIAVKNGVIEMVEKILESFPSTIKDVNVEGKNILLLAVEYRQANVFMFLRKQKWINESVFRKVDKQGNNALHLAARPGETKWFEFVKRKMPRAGLLGTYNRNMETPEEIFRESYKKHLKNETEWVVKTSEACSVVSTLVVSVAFSTRTSVPGGYDSGSGYAVLRNNPSEFKIFRDSSFAALFFSLFSTICFLSIVALSRVGSARRHSWSNVASKFNNGVYFMFASIVCLWISFCAADFFMLHDHTHKLKKTLPTYILLSMSLFLMVILQLPTFLRPMWSYLWSITQVQLRSSTPEN